MRKQTARAKSPHWDRRSDDAKPHEIKKAEVRDVVREEIAFVKVDGLRAVRVLGRIDAFEVMMTVPISVGGVRPIGKARTP